MHSKSAFHILMIKTDMEPELKFFLVQLLSQVLGSHLLQYYTYNRRQFQAKSLEQHHLRANLQLFVSHVRLRNHNSLIQALSIKAARTHKIWLYDSRRLCRPVNMPVEYLHQSATIIKFGQKSSLFAGDRLKFLPKHLINNGQGQNEHIHKGL